MAARLKALVKTIRPSGKVETHHQCAVCLEDLDFKKPLKHLKCEHCFHEECITRWLERKTTCPICRVVVTDRDGMAEHSLLDSSDNDDDDDDDDYEDITDHLANTLTSRLVVNLLPGQHLQVNMSTSSGQYAVNMSSEEHDSNASDSSYEEYSHEGTYNLPSSSDDEQMLNDSVELSSIHSDSDDDELVYNNTAEAIDSSPDGSGISDDEVEDDDESNSDEESSDENVDELNSAESFGVSSQPGDSEIWSGIDVDEYSVADDFDQSVDNEIGEIFIEPGDSTQSDSDYDDNDYSEGFDGDFDDDDDDYYSDD